MSSRPPEARGAELRLPPDCRRQLEELAREDYPREACGLLVGTREGERACVSEVVYARNLNTERPHDRYDLDPLQHLETERRAASAGLAIVGIWHSHPDQTARPSETDLRGAYAGWSYVIVSVRGGAVNELRSWRLDAGRFLEEILA